METHVVTTLAPVLVMGLYGGTYLTDALRKHKGKAPLKFMVLQFFLLWCVESLLHSYLGQQPYDAIWLGALNSAGATVIAKVSCWAYMYDEAKRQRSEDNR